MGTVKTKQPKKVSTKKAPLFLVGVDEEMITTDSAKVEKVEKKRSFTDEPATFEPTNSDVAKFRDMGFVKNIVGDIDRQQIEAEMRGWGIEFDLLTNPDTGEHSEDQCKILNEYISENADYVGLTIVDILTVVILNCDFYWTDEFDWQTFSTILNVANLDLLKLELGTRYHRMEDVGNATSFLKF